MGAHSAATLGENAGSHQSETFYAAFIKNAFAHRAETSHPALMGSAQSRQAVSICILFNAGLYVRRFRRANFPIAYRRKKRDKNGHFQTILRGNASPLHIGRKCISAPSKTNLRATLSGNSYPRQSESFYAPRRLGVNVRGGLGGGWGPGVFRELSRIGNLNRGSSVLPICVAPCGGASLNFLRRID